MDLLTVLSAVDVEQYWTQQFFGLEQGQRFTVMIVAIGCSTGVILGLAGIIYSAVDSVHRRRLEATMKREMIERGMSAEEIAKIIKATTSPEHVPE
jgi:hypothetical protein